MLKIDKLNNRFFTIIIISLIIFSLVIVCSTLSIASATDITIENTTNGGIKGYVNVGNDTNIILNSGTYKGSNNTNITINSNKNITIQSLNANDKAVIDCDGSWFINNIGNLTLINLIINNGYKNGNGGAISSSGTLTIINCTFTNNTGIRGGAIYNTGANMNVSNSNFINNNLYFNGTSSGGAIYNTGANMNVNNSNFVGNNATGGGGAIYNFDGANMSITNSNFTSNNAHGNGHAAGAIYNTGANLNINNSTFNDNKAGYGGGAIYNQDANMSISNSNFTNNSANNHGGVIYTVGDDDANNMIISNCTFNDNKVTGTTGIGGAISCSGCINMSILGSTFTNNHANRYGGAISIINCFNMTVADSNFTNNSANNHGGAVYNNGGANMTVTNSNFTSNNASYGGAITNFGVNMSVYDSTFIGNNATANGGGIYNGASMLFSGNVMSNNYAIDYGNVIYNNGTMGILNLTYLNNSTYYLSYGQNAILFATLTDDMGNPITGGNITFYVNTTLVGIVESIEGYANISYISNEPIGSVLPVYGTYDRIGFYDIIINNGELEIVKYSSNSTINAPNGKAGQPIIINGVAIDELGDFIANTEITIIINGKKYSVMTNDFGEWSLIFTPKTSGIFTAAVSWLGNDTHKKFNNSTVFTIAKIMTNSTINGPNGKTGQSIIVGVAIDEFGDFIANIEITVSINGEKYTTITNGIGEWNLIFTPKTSGIFTAAVSWLGNDTHEGFTNYTKFNINKTNNNGTNDTNKTNMINKTSNNSVIADVNMKKTGIPLNMIFVLLCSVLSVIVCRKRII